MQWLDSSQTGTKKIYSHFCGVQGLQSWPIVTLVIPKVLGVPMANHVKSHQTSIKPGGQSQLQKKQHDQFKINKLHKSPSLLNPNDFIGHSIWVFPKHWGCHNSWMACFMGKKTDNIYYIILYYITLHYIILYYILYIILYYILYYIKLYIILHDIIVYYIIK